MKRIQILSAFAAVLVVLTCCTTNDLLDDMTVSDPTSSTGSDSGATTTATSSTSDSNSEYVNANPLTIDFSNDFIANNFTAAATTTVTFSESGGATVDNQLSGDTYSVSGNYVIVTLASTGTILKLTGSASSGAILITSEKKFELNLSDLTLSNPNGTAINIQNGHCFVVVDGTNALSDASSSTYTDDYSSTAKSVFHSEDKLRFSGSGSLTVSAYNATEKHALSSDDWIMVNGPAITATAASGAGHGIKVNDGIYVCSGNVTATAAGAGKKGVNSEAFVYVAGGTLAGSASGGYVYDSSDVDYKAAAGISADGYVTVTNGTLTGSCSGAGGKGINSNFVMNIKGGDVMATATGNDTNTTVDKAPKGLKCDGDLLVEGGTVTAKSSNHEGLETKSTMTVTGGVVWSYSKDDAINSASTMTISGGYVGGYSTGNDAIDSNGNLYINGGNVFAYSQASGAEVAIDANTEGGYKLYVQGGTVVAYPSLEKGSSLTQACYTGSLSTSNWYSFSQNGAAYAFKVPKSGTWVVSLPAGSLYSVSKTGGTSIFGDYGSLDATISSGTAVSLSTYSGGTSTPGGGPGGGPGGW